MKNDLYAALVNAERKPEKEPHSIATPSISASGSAGIVVRGCKSTTSDRSCFSRQITQINGPHALSATNYKFLEYCAACAHHFLPEVCDAKQAYLKHALKWEPIKVGSITGVVRDWCGHYFPQNSFTALKTILETELDSVGAPLLHGTDQTGSKIYNAEGASIDL